ncbi:hypothetical protein MesoLjLa_59890 [Mesorhizobium sp. L-2-11]|nr:hypothetical protein MesoLjLa_59890 [Mesorhizobium sp. L-2-11]
MGPKLRRQALLGGMTKALVARKVPSALSVGPRQSSAHCAEAALQVSHIIADERASALDVFV